MARPACRTYVTYDGNLITRSGDQPQPTTHPGNLQNKRDAIIASRLSCWWAMPTLLGQAGLDAYLETKTVTMALD